MDAPDPAPNQIWRDTYYDRKEPALAHRRVIVVAVNDDGVCLIETIVNNDGTAPKAKRRQTSITAKNLKRGYQFIQTDRSDPEGGTPGRPS
jgi:hypothetical protein